MYNEDILKEVSRCKENERNELILAINKRLLSNLNLRNIFADELIEKVKTLPNSNTIGWMTAYGNILNIIVNNIWKQKDMEGKTGNLTNDNWNSKINVAPNYDATLPKMDIQNKNNYFKVNENRETSTIYGNNDIYTGKYNNMPNYIIDKTNINQVDKFKRATQDIKSMKEFSNKITNKLAGKLIIEISNNMASQSTLKKPIIIIPIQIKLKTNYVGIKTSVYTDIWKEWDVNYNIRYKFMRIIKLAKDINIKEIKLLVEKYSIHAIYTKFRIIGLNIEIMECTKENIWEIINIKDKIKIYLKLNIMEYDLFQIEEMKIQLMVLIIQNKHQLIQQKDYYGKDELEKLKWLANKEYMKILVLLQIKYGLK
jgi:hypothetical protein